MSSTLIAVGLWAGVVAGLALGAKAALTRDRMAAIRWGIAATGLITVLSWIGLFSVGPFLIVVAVLVTAVVVTRGLPIVVQVFAVGIAIITYWALTWGISATQRYSLIALPLLCCLAYGSALLTRAADRRVAG